MPIPCWLKHLCSIRALVPVSSLSSPPLFFRLILWSAEALWVHFPAWASKTLSRRRSVPSPHWEGTWGLREQSKPRVRDFIGFLCKPRNISLFLSPLTSYRWLWTTRFWSIKGPQHSTNFKWKGILHFLPRKAIHNYKLLQRSKERRKNSDLRVYLLLSCYWSII